MQPAENSLLGWIYREIDLTGVTVPVYRSPYRPSESFDWVLERIQGQYDSDNATPSNFLNAEWRLQLPQQNSNLQDRVPVKIPMTLNPGLFDQTAGTTRPKEYFFKSPLIDWPIKALQNFTIELQNYAGITTLRLLFIGHFILPKPVKQK